MTDLQDDLLNDREEGAARPRARRSRARSSTLLLSVSNRLAALTSLEEQLDALIQISVEATDADRGTLFLNDPTTGELYARVARGAELRDLRLLNSTGIAGAVFTTGEGEIITDAYADSRFSKIVDQVTGYRTLNLACAPIRTVRGEVLGVIQCLNKQNAAFVPADLELLEALATQATVVLQGSVMVRRMEETRQQEARFLKMVTDLSTEIQLGPLLQKIMGAITDMLDADRATLFLNDEKTAELYTEIGLGLGATKIRLPNDAGVAGTVFSRGETINIPYAYADLRFDPSVDTRTGYFTRSVLCVPLVNKEGRRIGVTQVLNKRGGPFSDEDEAHLKAFTVQIAICLENAQLFEDVQSIKNYNETMLESMSNGVLTFDGDGVAVTCNAGVQRVLRARTSDIVGRKSSDLFAGDNNWIHERLEKALESKGSEAVMDGVLDVRGESRSINLTISPLRQGGDAAGMLMMLEDISDEKRMQSTLSRYMGPVIAAKLMEQGQEALGGQSGEATILFTDVRDFTTLTEELGAPGTVSLLNEYFTIMEDCINREGGLVDKFIGDAIMAVFGAPMSHEDNEDRAVRAAISMINDLAAYNRRRSSEGKKPIEMGVGINTDAVVSGNIGSPRKMDYTVIGDGVNLASRLEGLCKPYGAKILASQNTIDRLRATYRVRPIDFVVVKGKTEPVAVHEVMDYHTAESFPNLVDVLGHFRDGLGFYRARAWAKGIACFEQALEANAADAASRVYVDRCRHFEVEPPPDDWRGEWVMTSK